MDDEAVAAGGEWWEHDGSGVYHRLMSWAGDGWVADCGETVKPTKAEDHRTPNGQVCAACHDLNDGGDCDDEDDDRRLPDTGWQHNTVDACAGAAV